MADPKYKEVGRSNGSEKAKAPTSPTARPNLERRQSSIKAALEYMHIPTELADDLASKKKRIGLFHSLVMGFCLMILLMTILATQEPYRYIKSNLAIQKGAHIADLVEDPDLNIDAIWDWYDNLSDEIGGNTYNEVVLNCGYSTYDQQTVTVDGVAYTMLNPSKLEGPCAQSSLGYINGASDPLYLIGSHQILATGIFTKRANTNFPIVGSVANTETKIEVNSDKSEPLNPLRDNKVVEVCSVAMNTTSTGPPDSTTATTSAPVTAPVPTPAPGPGPVPTPAPIASSASPTPAPIASTAGPTAAPVPGPAPGPPPPLRRSLQEELDANALLTTCIHKDGFAVEDAPYTPGSTMNWEGEIVTEDGDTYYTFDREKQASFFADGTKSFTSYPPCFITDEVDGQVKPGIPTYTGTAKELKLALEGCTNTWVSKGRDFRTQCLKQQNTGSEATAQQSYLAGFYKADSVPLLYEALYGCQSLIDWDVLDIDNAFVEARRPIESYLSYDQSYGAFFPTGSEQMWVEDAILGKKTLKMHGFLDHQTTDATVYIITRNLNADALFYTLIKVSFEFRVNGYSNVKYLPIFSPMIQFEYGTDGHGWRNRQMYIWEILFLVVFSLFALKEVYQIIFVRIIPSIMRLFGFAPISPSPKSSVRIKIAPTSSVAVKPLAHSDEGHKKTHPTVTFKDSSTDVTKSNDPTAMTGGDDGDIDDEPRSNAAVQDIPRDNIEDIEKGMSMTSITPEKPPPRPKSAGMIDLNRDGKDDLKQLENFMHDLNGNGIDDAEELMEFVDEYLPDAAGLLDILDWLTIGIVCVSIYYRVDYVSKTGELHNFFKELAEEGNYHEEMTELITRFQEVNDNLVVMNIMVMFLVFFGMVQFFRYLSFDRRLGIVTSTIKESLGSLLPVLLIFLVVMFAYSVLGTVMYGAHLSNWSNIYKSVSQLFLLILGEFGSYFDIMQINPLMSAIYFWSYIVMALFLLFNMVLAVIFTVYDEKNTEIMAHEAAEKERKEARELREKKEEESKKDK